MEFNFLCNKHDAKRILEFFMFTSPLELQLFYHTPSSSSPIKINSNHDGQTTNQERWIPGYIQRDVGESRTDKMGKLDGSLDEN